MLVGEIVNNIKGAKLFGKGEAGITSICDDSRKAGKGSLFIAVKGINSDGHEFIKEAVSKGAYCIVGERQYSEIKASLKGASYIKVQDTKDARGEIASLWYGTNKLRLKIIGVTGTDGKTTTANLIFHLLKSMGKKVGLISTLGAQTGTKLIDTGYHVTNPECLKLHEMLSWFSKEGCDYVVLEATSHGIVQKRLAGISFDVSVLTNITKEHLDYHKTFKDYMMAKIGFLLRANKIVVNKDDISYKIIKDKSEGNEIISYSIEKDSDFRATNICFDKNVGFKLKYKNKTVDIFSNMPGNFNIKNLIAALATMNILGFDIESIKKYILDFKLPEGRMQEIENSLGIKIYVDFAHTPNALENVLTTLRKNTSGKLICIFGCAGERDRTKRVRMGNISSLLADYSIFTAEDPRRENIFDILKKMSEGADKIPIEELTEKDLFKRSNKKYYFRIPERYEAIAYAINKLARRGDCIVVCGKGHEKSLAYDVYEHKWSDAKAVKNILKANKLTSAIMLCAGKGKRMHSRHPKVLCQILGRPMVSYTLTNLRNARVGKIIAVVGYKKDEVIKRIWGDISFAVQEKQLGTADAVSAGLTKLEDGFEDVIVLNGDDSAFYKPETINLVCQLHKTSDNVITFVSLIKKEPCGLGRIIRDDKGKVIKIVEEKDASEKEKLIKEVNDGLYVFDMLWLKNNIKKIKLSPQGEYYLVDLINIAVGEGQKVNTYRLKNSDEWQGINTPEELIKANKKMERNLNK